MSQNNKGFTIIELLIVIAIIGLLATISIVALNGARQKGRDAKRIGDIRQVQTALELYFNDRNAYPVAATPVVLGSANAKVLCDTAAGFQATTTGCGKVYMGIVPANPLPGGVDYSYTGTATTYSVGFSLEDATGSYASGTHTANQDGIN